MGTSQLKIYNGALRMCGEARLQSLTDNVEARYLCDDVWGDGDGLIQGVLEQGFWNFATRTSKLTNDTSIQPNFGYQCVFEKPADWVRTVGLCEDEYFNTPLTEYSDEAGYLFTNLPDIFFRYVSNGPDFGSNLGLWPQTFCLAAHGYLASQIVYKLTAGDAKRIEGVKKEAKRLMTDARSKAAMNEAVKFLPMGSWVRNRLGNRSLSNDGGIGGLSPSAGGPFILDGSSVLT